MMDNSVQDACYQLGADSAGDCTSIATFASGPGKNATGTHLPLFALGTAK